MAEELSPRLQETLVVADEMREYMKKLARLDLGRDLSLLDAQKSRIFLYGSADPSVVEQPPLSEEEALAMADEDGLVHDLLLQVRMVDWIEQLCDLLEPYLDSSEGWSRPSDEAKWKVLDRDDGTCQICGYGESIPDDWPEGIEVDHIIPSVAGGPGETWNLWCLCGRCHSAKQRHLYIPPSGVKLAVWRLAERD